MATWRASSWMAKHGTRGAGALACNPARNPACVCALLAGAVALPAHAPGCSLWPKGSGEAQLGQQRCGQGLAQLGPVPIEPWSQTVHRCGGAGPSHALPSRCARLIWPAHPAPRSLTHMLHPAWPRSRKRGTASGTWT